MFQKFPENSAIRRRFVKAFEPSTFFFYPKLQVWKNFDSQIWILDPEFPDMELLY